MRLYHNPRCSKSREAVALLLEDGIEFEEYRYLSMGVDPNDVGILSEIEGIVRTKDVIGEIDVSQLDLKGLQQLLLSQPSCLQRPVLIYKGHAVVGRPPENIIKWLNNQ